MLTPGKHAHPDATVLAAATFVLRELKRSRAVKYDDLKTVLARSVPSADYLFMPALSLLYILGLAEYRSVTDAFEYTGER